MRIGADASFLRWRRTGVARYLDGVLHAMAAQLAPSDELVVYYNSTSGPPLFEPPVRERFVRLPTATLWNQVRVPAALHRDGCDVYFGGAHVVPSRTRVPTVVMIHDCMSFRFPASKSRHAGAYYRRWTLAAARSSARIICNSSWTAEEAKTWLGVDDDKLRVVPLAAHPTFSPLPDGALAAARRDLEVRLGVPFPFVLQVGGFELHKGGDTAAAAIDLLRGRGEAVTLVRCGIAGDDAPRSDGTIDLGFVDDDTLHALYRGAAVVCVASTHEGFGFPVLEAMASGAPVVAARAAALPEIGGDVAVFAEPNEPASFADAIERMLRDPSERDERRRAGITHAATYTWERTARETLEVLREVAAR